MRQVENKQQDGKSVLIYQEWMKARLSLLSELLNVSSWNQIHSKWFRFLILLVEKLKFRKFCILPTGNYFRTQSSLGQRLFSLIPAPLPFICPFTIWVAPAHAPWSYLLFCTLVLWREHSPYLGGESWEICQHLFLRTPEFLSWCYTNLKF